MSSIDECMSNVLLLMLLHEITNECYLMLLQSVMLMSVIVSYLM